MRRRRSGEEEREDAEGGRDEGRREERLEAGRIVMTLRP